MFCIYFYLRSKDSKTGKKGTPYYVGYGNYQRPYNRHKNNLTPKDRQFIQIVIDGIPDRQTAQSLEIWFIHKYGRIDLGTGILRNRTHGGTGNSYNKGESPLKGRKNPKQSERNKGNTYGRNNRGKVRKKSPRGPQKIEICPVCGKSGGFINIRRYHFSNCGIKIPKNNYPKNRKSRIHN